jgi:hypothetical protein
MGRNDTLFINKLTCFGLLDHHQGDNNTSFSGNRKTYISLYSMQNMSCIKHSKIILLLLNIYSELTFLKILLQMWSLNFSTTCVKTFLLLDSSLHKISDNIRYRFHVDKFYLYFLIHNLRFSWQ